MLTVSNNVVTAQAVGNATLMLGDASTGYWTLDVSSTQASVARLTVLAYTSFTTNVNVPLITVRPQLSLISEGGSATLLAYATDDDGVSYDVTSFSGLSLGSTQPSNIAVSKNTSISAWTARVPSNANSVSGVGILNATLSDACSNVLFTGGSGYISSTLPAMVSATVTASSTYLAGSDVVAHLSPSVNIPNTATVTVVVTMGDNSTKVMTNDARTNYTLISSRGVNATLSGNRRWHHRVLCLTTANLCRKGRGTSRSTHSKDCNGNFECLGKTRRRNSGPDCRGRFVETNDVCISRLYDGFSYQWSGFHGASVGNLEVHTSQNCYNQKTWGWLVVVICRRC